jgi:hypothetical protein
MTTTITTIMMKSIILLFLVFSCQSLSQIQYDSLLALYNSTGSSNWKSVCNNWVFDNDLAKPCSNNWYGITCSCTSTPCTVTGLSITGCNLQGTLPTKIANLLDLNSLFFGYDSGLTGTIPVQLYSLNNLVELKLTNCAFTGKIATQLGNLGNLKYLSFDNNHLTGTIPSQVCSLNNVWYFSIDINSISGVIPDCIGSLSQNLKSLLLNRNSLTGLNICFSSSH